MQSSYLEKIFLQYLLQSGEYLDIVKPRFFETDVLRECYAIGSEFYKRYNQPPSKDQLLQLFKIKGKEDKITEEQLKIIYDVNIDDYESEWLNQNIEAWIEYKNLDTSVVDLINYLQTTKVNPENVKEIVQTAKNIIIDNNSLDLKFDKGLDFFDAASHEQPVDDTFPTGYEYIDKVTGGFSTKSLWVLMGAAKIGKCNHKDTKIRVRNKKTGKIETFTMEEFHNMTKKNFI